MAKNKLFPELDNDLGKHPANFGDLYVGAQHSQGDTYGMQSAPDGDKAPEQFGAKK